MADATISMLLNRLVPIIEKEVGKEVRLMLKANDEAEKLTLKLKKIQVVLTDAEQQGVMDRKVKSWLDKLQDISHDIDEVLDLWDVEIQKQRLDELDDAAFESSLLQKVCSFLQSLCLCFRKSMERRTIAEDIMKLNERLDLIAQENENEFKIVPILSRRPQDFQRVITTSVVNVSEVHGRDDDLKLLKEKLLTESSKTVEEDAIQIVSLVGMGGIGKSTLAQLAFNDHIVKDHFDVKIWVCVSEPFDQIKIAKAILEFGCWDSLNLSEFKELLQSITNSISGKRLLLVLDDVWTEDETMWNPLKIALSKNVALGSRILVTTRSERVANAMGSNQIQYVKPLSNSCCWFILSQIAFCEKNECGLNMLKKIGWKTAKKCKGMPLAAKVLGSSLRFKYGFQEWKNVLESKVWKMDEARTHVFPTLALSYDELHPAVKRCFSYCAIFPKDSKIYVDELVKIWMAQGFLYSSDFSGDMELKGRQYFEDLAMRSFFQDFERGGVGVEHVTFCKMHDLVHDFAQFLTTNECLIAENNKVGVKYVRHLNILNFEAKTAINMFSQIEKLCTFICENNKIPQNLFNHLKRVKVLKLNLCQLEDIPAEIGNSIHLRYLNLSENDLLKKLPNSICDLYNLQTLDLRWCENLSGLPHGIDRLVNLRHLFVHGTSAYFDFTQGLERLVNLRSLDRFSCKRESSNKLGYLKDLNLIGGSLEIHVYDMDDERDNVVNAENANLKKKTFIEHLSLKCSWETGLRVAEALQPSPNLRSLYFRCSYLPNWITTLTNLRKFEIEEGGNEMDALHYLRNLPFLEHLTLRNLKMEHLRLEFFGLSTTKSPSAFPNLLTFCIMHCWRLTEWEDVGEENENIISVLPRLQHLQIEGCLELKALPHRLLQKAASSLQKLSIIHCDYLGKHYSRGGRDEISHISIVDIK